MTYQGIYMTRLLLITLLVLNSGTAYAEWVAVENNYLPGKQTVYVDPDTVRQEGNLVTMVILIDWKWMQGNRPPSRFYSTKLKRQFDCTAKCVRRLAFTDFYGRMGTGTPIAGYETEGNWYLVKPESLNQPLWEVACNTQ